MLLIVVIGINVFIASRRIGNYQCTKPLEELSFTERIADKLTGSTFKSKQQLIDEGIIFSDEQKEAKTIIAILGEVPDLISTPDEQNTDEKILKCNNILDKLHEENASGRISTDKLIKFMDDCISMTENYKFQLQAYKNLEVSNYNKHLDKTLQDFRQLSNDLDRFGFKAIK